jgi:hypothetical protein
MYRASGGIAWTAAARCALVTANDPMSTDPHRHLLVSVKNNLIEAPTLAYRTVEINGQIGIEWMGPYSLNAKDLTGGEPESAGRLWEAVEIVFLILRHKPEPSTEVITRATKEGVARRTLDRAKVALKINTRRVGNAPWHWQWELPKDENPLVRHLREKYDALDATDKREFQAPVALLPAAGPE